MRLLDELNNMFRENADMLSIAALMEVVDELMDDMCIAIASEMEMSYEDVQPNFMEAKRKLKEKIEKEKYKCP